MSPPTIFINKDGYFHFLTRFIHDVVQSIMETRGKETVKSFGWCQISWNSSLFFGGYRMVAEPVAVGRGQRF